MPKLELGSLSSIMNKKIILILLLQAVIIISLAGYYSWTDSSVECVRCHADKVKMEELKHPEFYMTPQMVEEQSNHPYVECRGCHLGNGRAKDKDRAHDGMLKMLIVGEDGTVKDREASYPYALKPLGKNRITELLPKYEENGEYYTRYEVKNILWHDRDPVTFNFDPEIAKKTCSKTGCHPDQLTQFRTTIMGRNFRQRTMKTWTDPYGPHNCGPSFADTPPVEVLEDAGFDYANTRAIVDDLNIPFSGTQAEAKQKLCNICHVGCLDCHFSPVENKPHRFTKIPESENCAGYGRGTNICHPGAMQSRRGETYIGGDYSVPAGMEPDVHYKKKIHCVTCHPSGEKGMGDMERKAYCQDCHIAIEDALARSVHKNMDCATCHVNKLGGYQITIWGPGLILDEPNPFKKYSLYYGFQQPPLLMKDQKGIWMPVKIWPHSVGNIKNDVPPSPEILFRWPEGETRDAYYIVGTVDGLPGNNKHLLWLEIEQAAHPFGKSRTCESCHTDGSQKAVSTWEFYDYQGAEPFEGGYTILGDRNGVRITGMKNTTPINPLPGYELSEFASWLFMKENWKAPGDFHIPSDPEKYKRYLKLDKSVNYLLEGLIDKLKLNKDKLPRKFRDMKGSAIHDPDHGEQVITEYLKKN